MDLTLRTAHGSADVSVSIHDDGATVRDVIAATTGQAAPSAVLIDGQLIDTATSIGGGVVLNGSVIDTRLDDEHDPTTVVDLLQLTGPGAGTRRPLPPGRYRIGPSVRRGADELDFDDVEVAAFEIDVHASGATVAPSGQGPAAAKVQLDGSPLAETTSWTGGHIVVDGRCFSIATHHQIEPARSGGPGHDGRLIFNRAPGQPARQRQFLLDAVDDALGWRHGLWHERSAASGAPIDVGLIDESARSGSGAFATVDLAREVIAIAGRADDGEAVARATLIEAAARYGPADLDIVIATTPERLDRWDWAKWLPHVRRGESPAILVNELEMESWAIAQASIRSSEARLTLLVVTDDAQWNHAAAALRTVVTARPEHVAVMTLCADRSAAPSTTSTLIELDEQAPGSATLTRIAANAHVDIRVPLVDRDLAADVARRLCPLIDPEIPVAPDTHPSELAAPSLADIVAVGEAAQRWDTQLGSPGNDLQLGIGTLVGATVGVDVGLDRSVVISGSSAEAADAIAEVLAVSMTAAWSPTELSIIAVDHRVASSDDATQHLPQFAGAFTDRGPEAADRFVERLAHAIESDELSGRRVVIFVKGLAETELATPGLVDALARLASGTFGVHLVITTSMPLAALDDTVRQACDLEIAVDDHGGRARATLHDRARALRTPFSPDDPPAQTDTAITVKPFSFGRRPSALERRLERTEGNLARNPDRLIRRFADTLGELARSRGLSVPTALVPVPLPRSLGAHRFFNQHPGDGVPIGLAESADTSTPQPVWWLPGPHGSIVAVGSARSGMRQLLDVIACGAVERFAPADLDVVAIEHQAGRRTTLESIPHVVGVASPEQPEAVAALIEQLTDEVHRREQAAGFRLADHPARLLIVHDLERLAAPALGAVAHLIAAGAAVGINVIADTARPQQVDDVLTAQPVVLVGALSDPDDAASLGVQQPERVASIPGRCEMVVGGQRTLMQLAGLDEGFDRAIAARIEA